MYTNKHHKMHEHNVRGNKVMSTYQTGHMGRYYPSQCTDELTEQLDDCVKNRPNQSIDEPINQ